MQINLIKYLISSCPILTSSLRQPDNFWQTELFIHSINFHLDNSFLCTIFMDQHNNVTYPAQLLTAQCDRWGRQEEWWVQVQDIFIGFPFCLRGSDIERTVDREWVKPTSGDRWHDYCPPPLLHITPAIHIAHCRGLFSRLDIASRKQNHFPEMSLSGASETEAAGEWSYAL